METEIINHQLLILLASPVDLGNIETGDDYYFVVSWDPNPDNECKHIKVS